jgi:hypothetical protein
LLREVRANLPSYLGSPLADNSTLVGCFACATSAREETEQRSTNLENVCFICDIGRDKMEDMGPEFDFVQHKDTHHGIWNYLYFYLYLSGKYEKDRGAQFNGAESDIWAKIEGNEASWLPSRTSWHIQEHNRSKATSEVPEVERKVAKLGAQMAAFEGTMRGEMNEKFAEVRNAVKEVAETLKAIKRNTAS